MYSKVFVVLTFAAVAYSHDIVQGNNDTEATIVFEGHLQASPAIWKQCKDLFINASEHVISKINITDLRPDKDGDAQITAGGVGHNNVTITLKSPTILRGYDFVVSVYSVFDQNETSHESNNSDSQPPRNVIVENPEIPEEKVSTEISRDVTTGQSDISTESGPTTVTGKPSEVPTKPTEVTDSTATLGEVTITPKTKELSKPNVPETLDDIPEETPIHVEEQEPKKVQPFVGFHPPRRSTTERY